MRSDSAAAPARWLLYCRSRAFRIIHKRSLQFVGHDAEFVTAHVQQRIDPGLDTMSVGVPYVLPMVMKRTAENAEKAEN